MPVNGNRRPGDVQSVHRALQLLELVGDTGDMGVSELARDLGLAVSTVHNILRTLTHRGYLTNSAGRYRLGPAVTVLASQWDPVQSLAASVRPALSELSIRTGLAAYATVLVGSEAQLVGFTSAPGPVTVSSPGWTRANPLSLATGRVMVAFTRQPSWPEFVAVGRDADPRRSETEWHDDLRSIVETGVCLKHTADEQATVAVAVPVWTAPDAVICSVGCSAPGYFVTDELLARVLDALWDASIVLSRAFGCEPLPLSKPELPRTSPG